LCYSLACISELKMLKRVFEGEAVEDMEFLGRTWT